jgi:hypothetical protein
LEIVYETLKRKTKQREEELLSLLDEQKLSSAAKNVNTTGE